MRINNINTDHPKLCVLQINNSDCFKDILEAFEWPSLSDYKSVEDQAQIFMFKLPGDVQCPHRAVSWDNVPLVDENGELVIKTQTIFELRGCSPEEQHIEPQELPTWLHDLIVNWADYERKLRVASPFPPKEIPLKDQVRALNAAPDIHDQMDVVDVINAAMDGTLKDKSRAEVCRAMSASGYSRES